MATVINTNLASLFAQNSLSNAQNNLALSVQRLSSGLRINSAKDDAAGLAISQNMQSQINGTNQSVRNLSDATNLLQTADTSLSTIHDMLLRLKQLATQGYDGSLSTSQKLDIVQEMKDLNNEINATAQRTQFNGINLLTTGSSIDQVNSDLYKGASLTSSSTKVDASANTKTGYYATGGTGAATGLGDAAQTGGYNTTFAVILDPTKSAKAVGDFTLTANGANLTLTGTYNGTPQSQTVTIADVVGDATSTRTQSQTLDFSNFGISLALTTKVGAGVTQTGINMAAKLSDSSRAALSITGQNGVVSDVNLSGVAAGTYTLSAANSVTGALASAAANAALVTGATAGTYTVRLGGGTGGGASATVVITNATTVGSVTLSGGGGYTAGDTLTIEAGLLGAGSSAVTLGALLAGNIGNSGTSGTLTLSGTVNGISTTQSLLLADNSSINAKQTVSFDSFGVSFDVTSYQTQDKKQLAGLLSGLSSGVNATKGEIIVAQGANSALKFQSGPNSGQFIQIDTLNVQTGTSGTTAGQSSEMMTMGTRISQSGVGNLGSLGNLDSIDTWQTAFKNAAAAVDNAIEYISTKRATFGSQMNRLSYISTNLQAQSTNLQNSRSAIMDTDFAAETAKLTKGQIMQQAATAMLAQANQMPNVVLSLLK